MGFCILSQDYRINTYRRNSKDDDLMKMMKQQVCD